MRYAGIALLLMASGLLPAFGQEIAEETRSELSELLSSDADAGFAKAIEPRIFSFPADHGPHPAFRNEWWYFTGNLDAANGDRFGYELTIFRFGLAAAATASSSAWRTNQVYIAHFAVTDAERERFYTAERFSRGALGLSGAQAEPFRVWIDDWEIAATETGAERERWRLTALDDEFALAVELEAQKVPVLNGVDGLSQKSAEPGNASFYYSITRWQTDGELRVGDEVFEVSGRSWLDREWSSSALGPDQQGWDWFALQLEDGTELMVYNLRKKDGSKDRHSAGTWISVDGVASHLEADDATIDVLDTWTSPAGGTYPARWRVTVPAFDFEAEVIPVIADQELFTTVRYWEGAVDVTATRAGRPTMGRGYVELTGYTD